MPNRYLIIIPAYNVSSKIKDILINVKNFIPKENILVVNDGSLDSTLQIVVDSEVNVISHEKNRGKGSALITGFNYAIKEGYDAVITMDADGQHNPKSIPDFIKKFEESNADIIIGSRMKNLKSMPIPRRFSNTITAFMISLRAKQKVIDGQSGYRLIRTSIIPELNLKEGGFMLESELLIKAGLKGYKIDHIDIETIYADERSNIKNFRDTIGFIKLWLDSWGWR